ncbi:uncharacterized protein LOC130510553 [Raphanus sativus]|uniref:Uncharacterized protein LOC130510553 n=1 Tax=Raphanus sativus TaxID=3726 RepID=A0A9W3DGN6_RAPSA|nr:uncharacterized protein LOC130510553 [Raphanus sativus]
MTMTMVVWNMDDYPIPDAAGIEDDLGFIRTNIQQVVHRKGFHGWMEIDAYCKRINSDVEEKLSNAGIIYLPSCTRTYMFSGVNKAAPMDMTSILIHSALTNTESCVPLCFVVIAKAKPEGELDRVLKCLESRGHGILLIDPTAITGSFFSVESLLACARVLRPPPPRTDLSQGQEEVEEEDAYKIVDFLEPIRPVKEDRTGVFWDAEDFPFPPFSTPDEIYGKIESALLKRRYTNKPSIWVYLDDDKKGTWRGDVLIGDKKWWASRIYFLPGGGDKAARRIRMANDLLFWIKDSCPYTSTFQSYSILFSDQFKDDAEYAELLNSLALTEACNILSVIPTQDIIIEPESDPEWPGLLIDGGSWLGRWD